MTTHNPQLTTNNKKKTTILDRDASVLRLQAKPVLESEIGSTKLNKVIEKMKTALHGEDDGVAIAAPQIGESLRLFVVKGSTLALAQGKELPETKRADLVFINPEITKVSKKKKPMEEGCLSVRWLYGEVVRHEKVSLRALNEKGEIVTVGASGLMAQIFQHEIDHLDGVLFIDKAENLRDLPPADLHE